MRTCSTISSRACSALLLAATAFCGTGLFAAGKKVKTIKESRRSETREIESLETMWRTALVSGDALVMDKLLSDDFLCISARGTLSDKQQYLAHIASHETRFAVFDLMDLKVHIQVGSAVAVSQAHIQGLLEGHPIEGTFRYTKVYSRSNSGTWRMTNFEATGVSVSANESDMDLGVPLDTTKARHAPK